MDESRQSELRGIIATALAAGEGRASFQAKHAVYAAEVLDALNESGAFEPNWMPISDNQKNGDAYDLWVRGSDGCSYRMPECEFKDGSWWHFGLKLEDSEKPTHYMRPPNGPKNPAQT